LDGTVTFWVSFYEDAMLSFFLLAHIFYLLLPNDLKKKRQILAVEHLWNVRMQAKTPFLELQPFAIFLPETPCGGAVPLVRGAAWPPGNSPCLKQTN
jgi:hypothetical protein